MQNAFPLAAFRFVPKGRTQHLATLFSIRPPPRSKILAHTVFNDDDAKAPEREDAIAAHLAAYERIGTCFDADSIMDEVEAWALTKHYVHAQDQEDARSSTQSVMLRAEAERKHARSHLPPCRHPFLHERVLTSRTKHARRSRTEEPTIEPLNH